MERMNETLDLKLNELSANTAEVTGTAGMVNTAEMAESPTAAEQSGTEQSGTGLDALVCGTDVPQGTVVMAATPIGNTADASARLIALLERADIVAAEDTRRLYALANRLGVHVNGRVVAYHDHNERDKSDGLLDQVETGATVLVVSDAGMPTINDPGLAIVRRAIERGLPVTCAPGPSAVLDALCLSGLPTDRFCYEGFLPRKHSERVQYLRTLRSERRTIVFYETLHRIDDSMADLLDVFGPNRKMALCRELTKDFEQIRRGTIAQIRQSVIDEPPRGEMVLVVAGASEEEQLERIITQKWIAMFPNGTEAWSEFRRTGYPLIFPVRSNYPTSGVDTNKQIRRMVFPQSEYSNNGAAVQEAVKLLGGPDNGGTKLWWDKKN